MIQPLAKGHVRHFILFHKGKSFFSRLISWHTRGPYTHVSLAEPQWLLRSLDGSGQFLPIYFMPLFEAMEGRRTGETGRTILSCYEEVEVCYFDAPEDQWEAAVDALFEQKGKGYDWPAIFGFIIRKTGEQRKASNKWFCSELAAWFAEKAGVRLLNDTIEHWQTSPVVLRGSPKLRLFCTKQAHKQGEAPVFTWEPSAGYEEYAAG